MDDCYNKHNLSNTRFCSLILGLNFTWLCGKKSPLDLNNSDEIGCYYRAGDKEHVGHELRLNNSVMAENTSYFIKVLVTKDERQAEYTQEVYIVPGDPPEVQIRYLRNQLRVLHLGISYFKKLQHNCDLFPKDSLNLV